MIKAGVINKYSQVRKKKETKKQKQKKKGTILLLIPHLQGFPNYL